MVLQADLAVRSLVRVVNLAVQSSPRFDTRVPLLRAGAMPSVQLLGSRPWGEN